MRVVHRISVASSPKIRAELGEAGVAVEPAGLATFEIAEDDHRWGKIQHWVRSNKSVDIIETQFTKEEVARASWLEMTPTWHHGYPYPDPNGFGYRDVTYDLADYCDVCGIGLRQKAPFVMKAEPNWGRRSILQLNWVFDEYFVRSEFFDSVSELRALPTLEVLDPSGRELKSVVQLIVDELVDVPTDELVPDKCGKCGRTRYSPHVRGFFPPLRQTPHNPIAKTNQYFGSGSSSTRRVVISNQLAIALGNAGGVRLRPCRGMTLSR